jgi:membrane protein
VAGTFGGAAAALRDTLDRVLGSASELGPRQAAEGLVRTFREHRLLIQASALAFRVLLALIPLLLFGIGLLGLLQLEELWRQDLAPEIRPSLSQPVFRVIDDAVTEVLEQRTIFWVTAGLVIAIWEASGVVRAAARVLNAIYGVEEKRSDARRVLVSFAIAAAGTLLILFAIAAARSGPLLDDWLGEGAVLHFVGSLLGWLLAVAALLAAVGILVRAAPDVERPLHWVTFGALVVVAGWIGMSLLFGFYLTEIASYESVFGQLATVFILLEYLFLSASVFVAGLVLDSLVSKAA